ncbi:MAG: glycoside hydrolase family 15 protein [Actinomycetota bacterium]|nr:glycoside hydrolase family 15 protein [Actinomycetota bacterium]
MTERPIGDYALLGDTRTAALTSSTGSIDWMCAPAFDGEPLFGRLIGGPEAGSFALTVDDVRASSRAYRGDTAVLETKLQTGLGVGRLVEAMAIEVTGRLLPQTVLVRKLSCDSGELAVRVLFDPRLGLPGKQPRVNRRAGGLICEWGSVALGLQASPDIELVAGKEVSVRIPADSDLVVVMTIADRSPAILLGPDMATSLLDETHSWWQKWSAGIDYDGPLRDAVIRSFITLQLLTFSPSGAPVAAPTTSLPEEIGGSRNWDYRYSWPRDASIGLAAFLNVGKPELAHSYMHWLHHGSRLSRPRLKVLYTLFGKPPPKERKLDGAPGYRGSRPVRMGNEARVQHQLDVYGWVVDAAWLLTRSGRRLHGETWRAIKGMADFVADHWEEPDSGIWEVRGAPRHYVHSKMMAWLCLDRASRIADARKARSRQIQRWGQQRDRIRSAVLEHGFDESRNSYVRFYESDDVDAALLILPVLGLDDDPQRVQGTIEAIRQDLEIEPGLVFRYRPGSDDLAGGEGAFLPCSFWLVQALAHTGRKAEASRLLESLCSKANDVGLLSEEIDPESGELLGNFPQAFTHATLIQAALSLQGKDEE